MSRPRACKECDYSSGKRVRCPRCARAALRTDRAGLTWCEACAYEVAS